MAGSPGEPAREAHVRPDEDRRRDGSPFATVRLRQRVTKGAVLRAAAALTLVKLAVRPRGGYSCGRCGVRGRAGVVGSARFERELIRERTVAGLKAARARGRAAAAAALVDQGAEVAGSAR